MNEVSPVNGASQQSPYPQRMELSTDQAVESAALAGAAAIQKLVAERNELRTRLAAQEQETAAYRALNNELRRRLLLVHQTYVDMAKGVVGDLERFDAVLRESAQDVHAAMEAQMHWDDAASVPQGRAQNGAARATGTRAGGSPPIKP
ncbi:hypothetical protein AUC68_02905 [Methyloceanibacter methanicus]|uniref:Uncharacterized protein n=2 Tax=Methyloceanibacter methanicus TaxID=1774968 RepID=A0A1E3W2R2_9HYPH|nr:hypothetical protein AUC68_02905 [Methyloceanibacter methanicus]